MGVIKCPSCGQSIQVVDKKSAAPWLIGCLIAVIGIPVVLGIIGMLAAIAIPSFVKARNAAQMNACVSNMQMIEAATMTWGDETQAREGDVVDVPAVSAALGVMPVCPAQGEYTINPLGLEPECSRHGSPSAPVERRE